MTLEHATPSRDDRDVSILARLILAYAAHDGVFGLSVPGVHALRWSRTQADPVHALQQASVCIVAQGAKSVMLGDDTYVYAAAQVAVYSIDVPVAAQITRASAAQPCRSPGSWDSEWVRAASCWLSAVGFQLLGTDRAAGR
jgi:hypothetical protein